MADEKLKWMDAPVLWRSPTPSEMQEAELPSLRAAWRKFFGVEIENEVLLDEKWEGFYIHRLYQRGRVAVIGVVADEIRQVPEADIASYVGSKPEIHAVPPGRPPGFIAMPFHELARRIIEGRSGHDIMDEFFSFQPPQPRPKDAPEVSKPTSFLVRNFLNDEDRDREVAEVVDGLTTFGASRFLGMILAKMLTDEGVDDGIATLRRIIKSITGRDLGEVKTS